MTCPTCGQVGRCPHRGAQYTPDEARRIALKTGQYPANTAWEIERSPAVVDVDRPIDIDAIAELFSNPGPYPWTAARDARLALAELKSLRGKHATHARSIDSLRETIGTYREDLAACVAERDEHARLSKLRSEEVARLAFELGTTKGQLDAMRNARDEACRLLAKHAPEDSLARGRAGALGCVGDPK